MMDQATDAKILPSHNDFLTLDSTSLANRNSSQDSIAFSKGRVVDSSSSFNRFQFKHNYLKFIPKTQSLDIVDETSISGITTSESSFESINEELMQTDSSSTDDTRKTSKPMLIMPKLTSLDNNNGAAGAQSRPIFPNLSFSPYGSPRISRKPAKESRRVSIDKNGSFLQLNQYKLMDQIGQGSYGLVKLAYNEEDSQHYAMKILSKKKLLRKAGIGFSRGHPKRGVNATTPLDRVYREIAVLKKLDHPNVVKLVEVLDDPIEDALYMVFELVAKGPVLDIPSSKPLSEEYAWFIFRQVILGVEYLHYQKIIHGDLKPENLLLADHDVVKVADLGVCNEFLGDDSSIDQRTASGTPAFRAPETLSGTGLVFDGKKADIWSLGVTLFAFIFGDIPFKNQAIPKLYEQIQNEEVSFPAKISISDDIRDFITKMLEKNPEKRINMEQIKTHSWVTKQGRYPMPPEHEHCHRLVQLSEEDITSVVKSIPKLDTLILIKKMLKNHSFQNPFLSAIGNSSVAKGLVSRISRLERFQSSRSNSAPGNYQNHEACSSSVDTSTNDLNVESPVD